MVSGVQTPAGGGLVLRVRCLARDESETDVACRAMPGVTSQSRRHVPCSDTGKCPYIGWSMLSLPE